MVRAISKKQLVDKLSAGRLKHALDIALTSGVKLATAGLGALSAVIVAAKFGASGLGVFALLRAFPGILNILTDLGIYQSYPHLVNNRRLPKQFVFSTSNSLIILIASIQVILFFLIWPFAYAMLFEALRYDSVFLIAAIAPMLLIQAHVVNMARALDEIVRANSVRMLAEMFILLFVVIVWVLDDVSENHLVAVVSVANFMTSLAAILIIYSLKLRLKLKFHKALIKRMIAFGIKRQIGSAFQILNYRIDHLILATIAGTQTLGIYVVATKVAEVFQFLAVSSGFVLESRIAGRKKNASRFVLRAIPPLVFASVLTVGVAYLSGPLIIALMFEEWSQESILPFNILLIGLLMSSCNGLFASFFSGLGYPGLVSVAYGMALIVTLILNFALVPTYGVIGAAIASTASYSVAGLVLAAIFLRFNKKIQKV